jgi:hypothetical protein
MADAMRIDPGDPGDDGDAALDAALAAADEGMLAAISGDLDLEGRLAQILQEVRDLAGPAAWHANPQGASAEERRDEPEEIILRAPRSEFHAQVLAGDDEVVAGEGGDATLVLAVIETRSACVTLDQLVTNSALAEMMVSAGRAVSRSETLLKFAWRRYELIRVSVTLVRTSKTVRVIAADITRILVETTHMWEQASGLLSQADHIGMRLAEARWRLGSLPEAPGIIAAITEVLTSVGYAALEASGLDDALGRAQDLALALGQSRAGSFRRVPDVGGSGFKLHRTRDLIEVLAGEINDVGIRLGKLAEALTSCAGSIPLDQLAAVQVDASGADLSEVDLPDLDVLDGVIWTPETTWPPGVAHGVRSRSREIRPGVYQVCSGSERDPSKLAIV